MGPALCLVVIRSTDLSRARAFYEALGLTLTEEKHGNGPKHLACQLGEMVFEIYPLEPASQATTSVRLGFRVANVDVTVAAAAVARGTIRSVAKDSPWGRRAVMVDPDGHVVELLEAFHVEPNGEDGTKRETARFT